MALVDTYHAAAALRTDRPISAKLGFLRFTPTYLRSVEQLASGATKRERRCARGTSMMMFRFIPISEPQHLVLLLRTPLLVVEHHDGNWDVLPIAREDLVAQDQRPHE